MIAASFFSGAVGLPYISSYYTLWVKLTHGANTISLNDITPGGNLAHRLLITSLKINTFFLLLFFFLR